MQVFPPPAEQVSPSLCGSRQNADSSDKLPIWLWFNLLSLDAPVVAFLWQALFARSLHAPVRFPAYVALGATVWLIYIVDRLLDAARPDYPAHAKRHAFYRTHWKAFIGSSFAALLALAASVPFLSTSVLRNGIVLSLGVVAYFLLVHAAPRPVRIWWPKEAAVGVIFALGASLATWTKLVPDRTELAWPALVFAGLCALNCIAIEYWEWDHTGYTERTLRPTILWLGSRVRFLALAIALTAIACGLLMPKAKFIFAAELLSASSLFLLARTSESLSADALRVLADVALLTPVLVLFVP